MRFARNVYFHVVPGKDHEFTTMFNTEVLPVLKHQAGFRNEIALINGPHALGISLWDDRKSADHYATAVYPGLLKKLTPFLEGAPKVETYDVASTTLPM
jgi:hypothetical protein